ncbi:hypothetical protein [Lutibacter citreus]|uniref:hypothetical protein n=1 Tax=Lutibacter citreus TaxID=2138210 RepID=UPI000DBE650F|nr:hypothetical protein [Lutibacter citreus]
MNSKNCICLILLALVCSNSFSQKSFSSIAEDRYPKTVAFRSTEYALRKKIFVVDSAFNKVDGKKITQVQFARDMSRFPVIMGKMVDEERTGGTNKVLKGYSFSKKENPESKVILHFNGRNRRPEFLTNKNEPFYPGHWLYRVPNEIIQRGAISKEQKSFVLKDVSMFKGVNFKKKNIVFCLYAVKNKVKDFYHSEYVKVTDVDFKNNKIIVDRGYFKSISKEYKDDFGIAELAVFERKGNYRLYYNFSKLSPKDKYGRTSNEALADEIKSLKNGKLKAIDGVIFDAASFTAPFKYFDGNVDLNIDGVPEKFGFKNGVNQMMIGYDDFFKTIRTKMGPDFIVMADSRTAFHNRSFTYLNGTESEGWPQKKDGEFLLQWSTGLARHEFINDRLFDDTSNKLIQFNVNVGSLNSGQQRLIQVAAACESAAHTAKYVLDNNTGKVVGFTDEMSKGIENDFSGWLGEPLSSIKTLATEETSFKEVNNLEFKEINELTETEMPASEIILNNIEIKGKQFYVRFKIKGEPLENYPENIPRVCSVEVFPENSSSFKNKLPEKGIKSLTPYRQEFYVDKKGQEYGAYFRWISDSKVKLKFTIEGIESANIEWVRLYNTPDIIHREFENGIVIGNPSLESFEFDLEKEYPNQSFKKIKGFFNPRYNTGEIIGDKIILNSLDGIFLEKMN